MWKPKFYKKDLKMILCLLIGMFLPALIIYLIG